MGELMISSFNPIALRKTKIAYNFCLSEWLGHIGQSVVQSRSRGPGFNT